MPEDQILDTGDDAAQADQGDQNLGTVDTDLQADQQPQKPFTPEQEQFMGSWMGRIVKRQLEESLAPLIQDRQQAPPIQQSADHIKNFNEQVTEQFFSGDPLGAIDKVMTVRQTAQTNIANQNRIATDRAITQYSDDPLYKDIYQDMKKIAHDTVAGGYPPAAAAEFALAKAKTNYYENKQANPDNANLAMTGGGQQRRATPKVKLAPEFKKAFERDKAKGLFKDEADYINNLSPHIRAKYGM